MEGKSHFRRRCFPQRHFFLKTSFFLPVNLYTSSCEAVVVVIVVATVAVLVVACEQALRCTGAGVEGEPARMALNFECRVQILDAKY